MSAETPLPVRQLVQRALGTALVLVVGLALLKHFYGEALHGWGATFLDQAGGPGLATIIGIGDATGLPLPPEAFFGLALAGGMPYTEVLAWASLGSVSGGWFAYGVTSQLRNVPVIAERLKARSAEATVLLERYGVVAVIIELISPVPFSLLAWASGLLGVRPAVYFVLSMLRLVRHAVFLGLVSAGIGAG